MFTRRHVGRQKGVTAPSGEATESLERGLNGAWDVTEGYRPIKKERDCPLICGIEPTRPQLFKF